MNETYHIDLRHNAEEDMTHASCWYLGAVGGNALNVRQVALGPFRGYFDLQYTIMRLANLAILI